MTKPKADSHASVWDAITDSLEEAAKLRLRVELKTAKGHKTAALASFQVCFRPLAE